VGVGSALTSVEVVIPSFNGRRLLEDCLPSLIAQVEPHHVWVVDNGSVDTTADWLRSRWPGVHCLRNRRNEGFARAVNQGICASGGTWVALLNNDAIPAPDWLEHLVAVGLRPNDVGAIASRMMFQDAPERVSSCGIRIDPSGGAWDLWLGATSWPNMGTHVFGASGGACLLRREMLEDIGLFDEGCFAYLEDVDLAWRAQLRGWKAVLAPNAVVYHAMSATGGEGSAFKRYLLARNRVRGMIRCYPTEGLRRHLPVILLYEFISNASSLLRGDTVPLHGRLDAFKELPKLLAQRKAIQGRRTASWSDIERVLSPLESPLTLRRRARLVARLAGKRSSEPMP